MGLLPIGAVVEMVWGSDDRPPSYSGSTLSVARPVWDWP